MKRAKAISSCDTLTAVAEARLRAQIESGRYRPGEYLPSRARLMAELGASEFVIRAALARLSADHLVSGFRGRGYMVCERVSRRHMFVLDVNVEPWYSFGPCVSLFSCAKSLMFAGCRVLSLPLACGSRDEPYLLPLTKALKTKPDLVIVRSSVSRRSNALQLVERSGCHFVTVGRNAARKMSARYIGHLDYDYAAAVDAVVSDCVRMRIRSVLQVDFDGDSYCNAAPALAAKGIAVERLSLSIAGPRELDEVVRDSYSAMRKRIRRGCIPELVLLTDDYLAEGALEAMHDSSVLVPRDVKAISFRNVNSGIMSRQDISHIDFDPVADGRAIASSVLHWMKTGRLGPYTCPAVYTKTSAL